MEKEQENKLHTTDNVPRQMTGAELKSMLKSSIQFKSLGGMRCEELTLPAEDKRWWTDCKIGLFVHWGIYSVQGHGEWAKFNEQIPDGEYEKLADELAAEAFHPGEWVALAKEFGARYMVMVTRHHDGFALWDSPGSWGQFTSQAIGPHRDFVREYADACREAGLHVGLYYSTMDWRFPGYFDPQGQPKSAAQMKRQCYAQVEELCSRYEPDILWYDGSWLAHDGSDASAAWFWEPVELNRLARRYRPKLLINPRSGWEGDFYCDEGSHEIRGGIVPVLWEKNMCICSGSSWGYMENDPVSDFDWLIRMMVNVVCRGGNWLVNIGPDKNGKVPEEIRARIREVGEWLRTYGESIYETQAGPYEPVDGVYGSTFRGDTVYLHILDTKAFEKIVLPDPENEILDAALIDGRPVEISGETNASCAKAAPGRGEAEAAAREPSGRAEENASCAKAATDRAEKSASGGVRLLLPSAMPGPDTIVVLKMKNAVRREAADIRFTGKE